MHACWSCICAVAAMCAGQSWIYLVLEFFFTGLPARVRASIPVVVVAAAAAVLHAPSGQVWWLHRAGSRHTGLVTSTAGRAAEALLAAGTHFDVCFRLNT
jgi:hypothetical protein